MEIAAHIIMPKFIAFLFCVVAASLHAQETKLESVPDEFCIPLRLVNRSKANPEPIEREAVQIGTIQKDHFLLHERRFDVLSCAVENRDGNRMVNVVGKPDKTGGYSLTIIQPIIAGTPAQRCALVITWHPMNLAEKESVAVYFMLMQ